MIKRITILETTGAKTRNERRYNQSRIHSNSMLERFLVVFCFIATVEFFLRLPPESLAGEMIFELAKGQRYCFYETAKNLNEDVLVDFQVRVSMRACVRERKKERECL